MGLRDLFRRVRGEEPTTVGGLPGVPGTLDADTIDVRPAAADGSAAEGRTWSGTFSTSRPVVHVQTTTIGPDGVPHTTTSGASGEDVLAQLPPEARRQLEALGLDDLVTGSAHGVELGALLGGPFGGGAGEITVGEVGGDAIDKLRRLAELRDEGIVTDEEFEAQKARLLGEI